MLNVQDVDPVPVEIQSPEFLVFMTGLLSNLTSRYETLDDRLSPKKTSFNAKTGRILSLISPPVVSCFKG